ncbi:DUF4337 domain-containing protein [Silvanigrella aquatica]|uniref:DUF4337 domain-containing protein n=1 Tax=Silvanigrella aquatica TaxID=1915309 RepID=A0A1L4CY07_9BACT|nr:DUF4337 domain-containing protein [Silvanigrella aquatica]APJ02841.1 hypothetical protein AXG55_02460 [Silvanigrella aquatica]
MEIIEDPTERIKENITHEAVHKSNEKNIMLYAITSAFYAILTATTGLLAGYYSNEAMIEQIKASDQWAYYQSKSIKMNIAESKLEILKSLKLKTDESTLHKVENYKLELASISSDAKEKESNSKLFLKKHVQFAKSVTLFQVAIGMTAFAILTRKRIFWYISMAFAFGGLYFFGLGLF